MLQRYFILLNKRENFQHHYENLRKLSSESLTDCSTIPFCIYNSMYFTCVLLYVCRSWLVYMCIVNFCYHRMIEEMIDDAGAVIVTRYLSSFRSLSKSFDFYLLQVTCIVHLCVCVYALCVCVCARACVCYMYL